MVETHVTITGNLTDDPELKFTPQGTAVANFRIAVTTRVRDGESWRDGDTSFFRVNAWRDLAEHVGDSLSKGDRTVVIGRLRSRSWETADGEKRSVTEIEADEVAASLRWATATVERVGRRSTAAAAANGSGNEPAPF